MLLFAAASTSATAGEIAAAKRLDASHVLAGSVERSDEAVVNRARLLESRSSTLLWSDRFDCAGAAPWTWQHDIAQRIAQSLDVRLREPLRDARADRLDAVAATRHAIHLAIDAGSRADLLQARSLLERALAADADSAIALTFWAFTHTQEVMRRWSRDPEPQIAAASAALDHAFAVRPDYWPVHFHRSFVLYLQAWIDDAARAFAAGRAARRLRRRPDTSPARNSRRGCHGSPGFPCRRIERRERSGRASAASRLSAMAA